MPTWTDTRADLKADIRPSDSPTLDDPMHSGTETAIAVPTLSIVVPAYNVAAFIREAVESALDQTFRDLEVVVIDDGSTDTTPQVLADIVAERNDPRLRVIRQPNGGLAAARNSGIRESRGEFIGFLDSDDIWHKEKAERQLELMRADPSIGISFSHSEYLLENGTPTGRILVAGKDRPTLHDMIRRNHLGNGSTPIVRRACFDKAGVFHADLKSCEDYEMWARIVCLSAFRIQLLPEPLTQYRLRESSLSFNFAKFTENADRSIRYLEQTMPAVPRSILRVGHAEHYRIAAWKAVSTGQKRAARELLFRAISLRPLLLFRDWRAVGTLLALGLPGDARTTLAGVAKAVQQRQTMRTVRLNRA